MIIPFLSVGDIRTIVNLWHDDIDMNENTITTEMIKISINTLNSDHIIPEEQLLGYFTRKKLKRLTTWKKWKDRKAKQLK